LFTVGDLNPLKVLGIPQILEGLFYVAVRSGHAHERYRESGGHGNGHIVCRRSHDGRTINLEWKLTITAVSVTLRTRNESMRAVLVLGEMIGVVEASLKPRMLPAI
jgi:hypothetical protein